MDSEYNCCFGVWISVLFLMQCNVLHFALSIFELYIHGVNRRLCEMLMIQFMVLAWSSFKCLKVFVTDFYSFSSIIYYSSCAHPRFCILCRSGVPKTRATGKSGPRRGWKWPEEPFWICFEFAYTPPQKQMCTKNQNVQFWTHKRLQISDLHPPPVVNFARKGKSGVWGLQNFRFAPPPRLWVLLEREKVEF